MACSLPGSSHNSDSTTVNTSADKISLNEYFEDCCNLGASQQSARSTFSTNSKEILPSISSLPSESIVLLFMLSAWDNVVGPQTVIIWDKFPEVPSEECDSSSLKEDDTELAQKKALKDDVTHSSNSRNLHPGDKASVSDDTNTKEERESSSNHDKSHIIQYVTSHIVGFGEVMKSSSNCMSTKFLIVPHKDIIILAIRFHIIENDIGNPYCLSVIIPYEEKEAFLPMKSIFSSTLHRIAIKARLLIIKNGKEGIREISDDLLKLCDTVSCVQKCSLSNYPVPLLAMPPSDRRLAERSLSSHLQTKGYSMVIADSPSVANKVVMWLSQYSPEEHRPISKLALTHKDCVYHSAAAVQAVIRDSDGGVNLCSSEILTSFRPLTIVDLCSNTVRQMLPTKTQTKNSCAALKQELLALWYDLEPAASTSKSIFENVKVTAPLVKNHLAERDLLSSCEDNVKESFLKAFLRSLQYTALSISVWIRKEWFGSRRKRQGRPSEGLRQELMSTFLLEEADLRILVAEAEKFDPGILNLVF